MTDDMTLSSLFHSMHQDMTSREFLAGNPLFKRVSIIDSTSELAQAIRQYVRLPEEIVSCLKGAAAWFPEDHPIHCELKRNWNQEGGSATGGVPHVEILKSGLKRDLGIDADAVTSNQATKHFLDTIDQGMKGGRWFAVGQAYALEATAVPELALLVGPLLNFYAAQTGKPELIEKDALREDGMLQISSPIDTREQAFAMTMTDWFALHVLQFEVGHRDFLRAAIQVSLSDERDISDFLAGFRHLLSAMDEWWRGIGKQQ